MYIHTVMCECLQTFAHLCTGGFWLQMIPHDCFALYLIYRPEQKGCKYLLHQHLFWVRGVGFSTLKRRTELSLVFNLLHNTSDCCEIALRGRQKYTERHTQRHTEAHTLRERHIQRDTHNERETYTLREKHT